MLQLKNQFSFLLTFHQYYYPSVIYERIMTSMLRHESSMNTFARFSAKMAAVNSAAFQMLQIYWEKDRNRCACERDSER